MHATAVIFEKPGSLSIGEISLTDPTDSDLVVQVEWSGISTGTERLLWTGRMPDFPGLAYPLVPGYESVGRVVEAGSACSHKVGERVFVPGATCFGEIKGLFGGTASKLVVPDSRALSIDDSLQERGTLLALAATAHHILKADSNTVLPDLIVGHGVLGRLLARLVMAYGHPAPTVWESDPNRMHGASDYSVVNPYCDQEKQYKTICDVSGNHALLDDLIKHLSPGGEIILAGFYDKPLSFDFPPAFMRELHLRVAAEWKQPDLIAVNEMIHDGSLSLDGLISNSQKATHATSAYRTAFEDSTCLKMILDWRVH